MLLGQKICQYCEPPVVVVLFIGVNIGEKTRGNCFAVMNYKWFNIQDPGETGGRQRRKAEIEVEVRRKDKVKIIYC